MPQEKENFINQGFLIVKKFLDLNNVNQILADVKEIFAIQIGKLKNQDKNDILKLDAETFSSEVFNLFKTSFDTFSNCSKQAQHMVSLHQLGTDNKILSLLKELGIVKPIVSVRPCLLMNNIKLDKDGVQGRYWRLPSHQDWYYSQGSLDAVTFWFPLIPVPKKLGALEIVPESHKWGLQEAKLSYGELDSELPDEKYISFDLEPTDILIFNSLLIHRSGKNETNLIRWSAQYRYNNLYESTFINREFPNPYAYYPTRQIVTPNFPSKNDLDSFFQK